MYLIVEVGGADLQKCTSGWPQNGTVFSRPY